MVKSVQQKVGNIFRVFQEECDNICLYQTICAFRLRVWRLEVKRVDDLHVLSLTKCALLHPLIQFIWIGIHYAIYIGRIDILAPPAYMQYTVWYESSIRITFNVHRREWARLFFIFIFAFCLYHILNWTLLNLSPHKRIFTIERAYEQHFTTRSWLRYTVTTHTGGKMVFKLFNQGWTTGASKRERYGDPNINPNPKLPRWREY